MRDSTGGRTRLKYRDRDDLLGSMQSSSSLGDTGDDFLRFSLIIDIHFGGDVLMMDFIADHGVRGLCFHLDAGGSATTGSGGGGRTSYMVISRSSIMTGNQVHLIETVSMDS